MCWSDISRIDRIRRAHAKKYNFGKQNWVKKDQDGKKPWYCKLYQVGQCHFHRDHEYAGKMQKHICSFCLSQGHISANPEKECQKAKLKNSKNVSGAAQNQ